MNESLELLTRAVLIGIGGSAFMDLWGLLLRRFFGIQGLDYALLGRWIGHIPQGRLVHRPISATQPVPGERPLGWLAHYSIGVVFAVVLLGIWGLDWAAAPTPGPALVVGLTTIIAPWFVMQPCMGAGVAGSRTPRPSSTRLRNLMTHTVYGLGTYATALLIANL